MSAVRPLLHHNARRAARHAVSFRSELRHDERRGAKIHVVDISPLGFCARCDSCPAVGSVQIKLPGIGFVQARVVWSLGGRIGGEFSNAIDPEIYDQVLRAAPDETPWHD